MYCNQAHIEVTNLGEYKCLIILGLFLFILFVIFLYCHIDAPLNNETFISGITLSNSILTGSTKLNDATLMGKTKIDNGLFGEGVNLNTVTTGDLGLYQSQPGKWMRYSVNQGEHVWYLDGNGQDARNMNSSMRLNNNGLTLNKGDVSINNGKLTSKKVIVNDGMIASVYNGKKCRNKWLKEYARTTQDANINNIDNCLNFCNSGNYKVAELSKEATLNLPNGGCTCSDNCLLPEDNPNYTTAYIL